jgi:hypothetical protein
VRPEESSGRFYFWQYFLPELSLRNGALYDARTKFSRAPANLAGALRYKDLFRREERDPVGAFFALELF